jgi:hypothetical protein
VNGQVVETDNQEITGQILVPVTEGQNRVQVVYVRTRDQVLGDTISGVTASLMLGFFLWKRRTFVPQGKALWLEASS